MAPWIPSMSGSLGSTQVTLKLWITNWEQNFNAVFFPPMMPFHEFIEGWTDKIKASIVQYRNATDLWFFQAAVHKFSIRASCALRPLDFSDKEALWVSLLFSLGGPKRNHSPTWPITSFSGNPKNTPSFPSSWKEFSKNKYPSPSLISTFQNLNRIDNMMITYKYIFEEIDGIYT